MSQLIVALAVGLFGGTEPRHTLSAEGTVQDAQGRPVAGATVYLRVWALAPTRPAPSGKASDVRAKATTDAHGRFAFQGVSVPELEQAAATSPFPFDVVVKADGYGLAWERLTGGRRDRKIIVTLLPGRAVEGRLLDPQGQPAAGVRIRALRLQALDQPWSRTPNSGGSLSLEDSAVAAAAVSDAEGRFVLGGLPPEVGVALELTDDRFARHTVLAATTDRPQPNAVVERVRTPEGVIVPREEPVHTGPFTVRLQPGYRLDVRVVFADTGKPAAGARLSRLVGPATSTGNPTANESGEFSVPQLPAGRFLVGVSPPAGSRCLGAYTPVTIPSAEPTRPLTVRLPAGTQVVGEVVSEGTGQGIPGVVIAHQPASSGGRDPGPFAAAARTGPDGRFRIAVPPGRGWLRVSGAVPGYFVETRTGREKGLAFPLDVQPGREVSDVKFVLSRGRVVEARVLDPDGEPLAGVRASGHVSDREGRLILSGLDPRKSHTIVFAHPERALAARASVTPPVGRKAVNLEVRLRATAAVAGRVRGEDGRRIPGARVLLLRRASEADGKITFYSGAASVPVPVGADGGFLLEDLVADLPYNVSVSAPGFASAFGVPFEAEAARTHRLPEIVLPRADQSLAGVVVDPRGKPLAGVQVFASPVRGGGIEQSVRVSGGQVVTDREGRFRITGLPRGRVRLSAYLTPPAASLDRTIRTTASLQVEAGRRDVQVVLQGPQTEGPVEAATGKPAPEFPVGRWAGRDPAPAATSFRRADFAGKAVLLAFGDEARPSQRLRPTLHRLQEKFASRGFVVIEVCESADGPAAEIGGRQSVAALVAPGLVPGGYSEAFQKYGVKATPTLFLLDREGTVRQADMDLGDLEKALERALGP